MRNDASQEESSRHEAAVHKVARFVCAVLICVLLDRTATAEPGDAALPGNHPLIQRQAGEVLIAELNCGACHDGARRGSLPQKTAPDLAEAGARLSPAYLQRFLVEPSAAHPGTTMPDMLASRPPAERGAIALALTHFLVAQATASFASETPERIDLQQGRALYHSVGCVACHAPQEASPDTPGATHRSDVVDEEVDARRAAKESAKPIAIGLGHVRDKYSEQSLAAFLFEPLRVRSSGRMPDMKLDRAESQAIAAYLMGEQPPHPAPLIPESRLVALGKEYFAQLNCAACHSLPGSRAAPLVGSLENADLTGGCLSNSSGRSPRFYLGEAQIQAIKASLRTVSQGDADEVVAAKTLVTFNCIACHVRDHFGGVDELRNPFFTTSEPKLGDDGRLPPPLTLIGAKLQPAWLKKVLFDGESVRPYMTTRMPQYGTANLRHLPDVFTRLDHLDGPATTIPDAESDLASAREEEQLMRAAGRELLGDKGVNCIACHQFNGKAAVANQGMDLLTSYQRLQPAWFNRFLRNPGGFRPRTIMPTAWPDNVAAYKTILGGDTDRQIAAIWYYLSLGTSAADPSGIRPVSTKLTVSDKARTYRGRSRVAGFRGIAVGLPERLSYAFNAETGTLTAIWQGDFIDVNWSGQGSGDFHPASRPATLAQDVSFVQLPNENSPWPLLPVMTQDARTNPDPLYPKNLGYQFLGYYLDESSIPTFKYRSGTLEIEDRSIASRSEKHPQLKRVLRIDAPSPQSVWFRALTGEIVQESDRVFRRENLRLTIPSAEPKLRSLSDDPERSELLLRLDVPRGKSSLECIYELVAD